MSESAQSRVFATAMFDAGKYTEKGAKKELKKKGARLLGPSVRAGNNWAFVVSAPREADLSGMMVLPHHERPSPPSQDVLLAARPPVRLEARQAEAPLCAPRSAPEEEPPGLGLSRKVFGTVTFSATLHTEKEATRLLKEKGLQPQGAPTRVGGEWAFVVELPREAVCGNMVLLPRQGAPDLQVELPEEQGWPRGWLQEANRLAELPVAALSGEDLEPVNPPSRGRLVAFDLRRRRRSASRGSQ